MADLRKDGVATKSNVMTCCKSCATPADINATEGQPYAYTFGGQGMRIVWTDGGQRAVFPDRKDAKTAYINHGNGAGKKIAAAFRAHGFTVMWNGTEGQTICVALA